MVVAAFVAAEVVGDDYVVGHVEYNSVGGKDEFDDVG